MPAEVLIKYIPNDGTQWGWEVTVGDAEGLMFIGRGKTMESALGEALQVTANFAAVAWRERNVPEDTPEPRTVATKNGPVFMNLDTRCVCGHRFGNHIPNGTSTPCQIEVISDGVSKTSRCACNDFELKED